MKIISLNTWAGRAGKEKLLNFFNKYIEIDIFCVQEIWEGGHEYAAEWGGDIDTNLLSSISGVLKNHKTIFHPHHMDWYGQAVFIKKEWNIINEGDVFVFKDRKDAFDDNPKNHARNIQFITVNFNNKPLMIINFHELWNGEGKGDSTDRINQSKNIIKFIKEHETEIIICGDFNLLPNTESIKIIEEIGLVNLIKEKGVISTRSSYYSKPEKFADYVFASPSLRIKQFKVLKDEVSDHLPLYS